MNGYNDILSNGEMNLHGGSSPYSESKQLHIMMYGLFAIFIGFLVFAIFKRRTLLSEEQEDTS